MECSSALPTQSKCIIALLDFKVDTIAGCFVPLSKLGRFTVSSRGTCSICLNIRFSQIYSDYCKHCQHGCRDLVNYKWWVIVGKFFLNCRPSSVCLMWTFLITEIISRIRYHDIFGVPSREVNVFPAQNLTLPPPFTNPHLPLWQMNC